MRALLIALAFATLATGCVGGESGEPPIVGIRNMYNQPRYDTQERQPFFADQRSMRPQVEGAVSREMERSLTAATGLAADEGYLLEVPPVVIARRGGAAAFLKRGKDRYEIFCASCHSVSGDGKGMVSRRALQLSQAPLAALEDREQSK
jgi:cytochrome c